MIYSTLIVYEARTSTVMAVAVAAAITGPYSDAFPRKASSVDPNHKSSSTYPINSLIIYYILCSNHDCPSTLMGIDMSTSGFIDMAS